MPEEKRMSLQLGAVIRPAVDAYDNGEPLDTRPAQSVELQVS